MPDQLSLAHTTLAWSQPKSFQRFHELTANGETAGSLAFETSLGSLATAAYGHSRWTFKRVGFFSPRITIREAGAPNDLAVFTPTWTGAGSVEFATGRRFRMRSLSFWGTEWAFEDEQGNAIVTLHGPQGILKTGGESVVTDAGAGLAETPVLLLLLWYVRLLANEDAAAAGAVVACCG